MGNKNKKSNLRKITVNDQVYYWTVNSPNCDGDYGSRYKIWKDKKVIFHDVIHGETITPKNVREKILELSKQKELLSELNKKEK